ncbi:hypothetical protein PM082_024841 [Marasmius tenuissimus]|nr:hypothetical protein PM082_024841 [Marasmius tenuissimus]
MVHRCYVIWGYSKWILYPFTFIVLVSNTMGLVVTAVIIAAYDQQSRALLITCQNIISVLTITAAIYDSLLTLLMAGRIWYTICHVGQITGGEVCTKYKIFVAIILESGLLYSATQGLVPFDFSVMAVQMAGIAQTVIVVRIAYGQAVESVQQMVSTLHFAEGANNLSQQSMAAHGSVDLRQSLVGVEERGMVGRIEKDKPPLNVAGIESHVR